MRGDIADLLADFAGADGSIERRRLNRLLRELDEVERNIRRYGDAAMSGIITETADWTTTRINNGLERAIGSAGVTANMEQINRQVVNYVARRFESDGLVLSDRVWRLAGDERDKIASVLRTDILRGESVGTMIRNVRRVHDNDTWKIERLVVTEGNTAYRAAADFNAKASEVVTGLRLHPGIKRSKGCVDLANEDRYGLGKGVFLPGDSDVYNPHPNCTSYVTYEIDSRWL